MNPFLRLIYLATGRLMSTRPWTNLHRRYYQMMPTIAHQQVLGIRIVLLKTVGRKSGEPRSAPVIGWSEGETVIVVASNAGRERHPAWYLNLVANPEVELNSGGQVRAMRAREATSGEREALWPKLVRGYGGYGVYRSVTDRSIPVVILEPR